MTRPPEQQARYRTPTGETISALNLHHRLKAGRVNDTKIISGEEGGIWKVITPEGAYELIENK